MSSSKNALADKIQALPGFRPLITLVEIAEALKVSGAINPVPSRTTLQNLCYDGTLETPNKIGTIYVYEDSFLNWVKTLMQSEKQ